jgi:DNA-binding transcriptional LysR family regulator
VDIRFISSLIAVVDTGSIAGAARNQMLTSAAISQRVKALEVSLDCQLLSRSGHTAKPTSACLKILPRLRNLILETAALRGDLDETGLTGELKVGAISTVLTGLLPSTIEYLTVSAPKLNLKIFPGTSAYLYAQLMERNIDAIIIVAPPFAYPKHFKVTPLFTEPLGFISSESNNIDIKSSLLTKPYIQYDRTSWGGAVADSYLVDNNIHIESLCEIDALESIVLMVKREMGVSLIPIWRGLKDIVGNIKVIPILEQKYYRQISLISHRQAGKEPLIKAFFEGILHESKLKDN